MIADSSLNFKMKNFFIILIVSLAVFNNHVLGMEKCFSGLKIRRPIFRKPKNIRCNEDESCLIEKASISLVVDGNSYDQMVEKGSCVPAASCSRINQTCNITIESTDSQQVEETTVNWCVVFCRYEFQGRVPDDWPACQVPQWNPKRYLNWPISNRKPAFELVVRNIGNNRTYKPGNTYKLMIKNKQQKTDGFFVTIESNSTNCSCINPETGKCRVGKLLGEIPPGFKAGAAVSVPYCDQPLAMDYRGHPELSNRETFRNSGKWIAPDCSDVVVKIKATVRDRFGRIYSDSDDFLQKKQVLTKIISPDSHA